MDDNIRGFPAQRCGLIPVVMPCYPYADSPAWSLFDNACALQTRYAPSFRIGVSDGIIKNVFSRVKTGIFPAPVSHYTETFRNRYAPTNVMAAANPATTARQTSGLMGETPVRPYRIPSTPYVSGSA